MLQTGFNDKMTNEMLGLLDGFQEAMEKEYLYCEEQYQKFNNAIVKLPHVNERGISVVHGANVAIDRLAKYWLIRRDATKDFLSIEFVKEHNVNLMIRHR